MKVNVKTRNMIVTFQDCESVNEILSNLNQFHTFDRDTGYCEVNEDRVLHDRVDFMKSM